MVFAGLFPADGEQYSDLRDALEKLKLNDASLQLRAGDQPGARIRVPRRVPRPAAHGGDPRAAGARVRPRADRHHAERRVPRDDGTGRARWRSTTRRRCPTRTRSSAIAEPYVKSSVIVPKEYVGTVMELCQDRRGEFDHMEYLTPKRRGAHLQAAAGRDRARLLRPAEVAHARATRRSTTRSRAATRLEPGQGRHPAERRRRRRAVADRPPRQGLRRRPGARRAAARDHPAPDVRRAGAGRDRLARDRARDDQGDAQGRAVEVLRRRHHAASAS